MYPEIASSIGTLYTPMQLVDVSDGRQAAFVRAGGIDSCSTKHEDRILVQVMEKASRRPIDRALIRKNMRKTGINRGVITNRFMLISNVGSNILCLIV